MIFYIFINTDTLFIVINFKCSNLITSNPKNQRNKSTPPKDPRKKAGRTPASVFDSSTTPLRRINPTSITAAKLISSPPATKARKTPKEIQQPKAYRSPHPDKAVPSADSSPADPVKNLQSQDKSDPSPMLANL